MTKLMTAIRSLLSSIFGKMKAFKLVFILGAVIVCLALVWQQVELSKVELITEQQPETDQFEHEYWAENEEELWWFDVSGAVNLPGVIVMPVSAQAPPRISDVLNEAGGLSEDADFGFVAEKTNLVDLAEDGQKIFIPYKGLPTASTGLESTIVEMKTISVNSATKSELQSLTGVGEARSQKIIDGRPYKSLTELVELKVLTQKILDDNEGLLSL